MHKEKREKEVGTCHAPEKRRLYSSIMPTDQVHFWSVILGKRMEIDQCPHVILKSAYTHIYPHTYTYKYTHVYTNHIHTHAHTHPITHTPTTQNAATQNEPQDVTSVDLYWRAPLPPNTAAEYQQLPLEIKFW